MAKRQRRTLGSILEIDLENGYFGYAQIINDDIMFYDIYSDTKVSDLKLLEDRKPLFFLGVYDDVITKGRWKIVGKLPIKEENKIVPNKFIQDSLNPNSFELYNPNTGEIIPSKREEVEGLECAAVWEAEHVEDRLRDHYHGKSNVWVEQLAIK